MFSSNIMVGRVAGWAYMRLTGLRPEPQPVIQQGPRVHLYDAEVAALIIDSNSNMDIPDYDTSDFFVNHTEPTDEEWSDLYVYRNQRLMDEAQADEVIREILTNFREM